MRYCQVLIYNFLLFLGLFIERGRRVGGKGWWWNCGRGRVERTIETIRIWEVFGNYKSEKI